MKKPSVAVIAATALAVSLGGCAHWPSNPELDGWNEDAGYRYDNLGPDDNTETLFVVLAFSGGGTRAASLAYGALEQLRLTKVYWEGKERSLLSEVDVISSVSGGSFTALYYGLHGEGSFTGFSDRFLYAPIQKRLLLRALAPWNWFRLASPHFDRIDLAAELYDEEVFDGRTYRSLIESGRRPYLIVNATDISLGARFEFTQDQFDLICSDLAGLSVGRAAAASSAFPGLLSPITLRSYSGCGTPLPSWFEDAIEDREFNPSRYQDARRIERYFDEDNRFVHLIDGGVSDNIGLRAPLHAIVSNDSPWSLVDKINEKKVKILLVITVNAKTAAATEWGAKKNAPSLIKVLKTSGNTPLEHYSFETVERVRREARDQNQLQQTVADCQHVLDTKCPSSGFTLEQPQRVDYRAVEINFEALDDPAHREFFQSLPTTFQLDRPVVDCLRGAAGTIMVESEAFTEFLDDMDSMAEEDGVSPPARAESPGYEWPCTD